MNISQKDVENLALLSRIELTAAEKESFTRELDATLGFMNKLNELDTQDIPPTVYVLDLQNVLREDIAYPGLDPEQTFQNAPEHKNGLFSVPRII